MQPRSPRPVPRHWINPGRSKLSLMSAWIGVCMVPGAVGIALCVAAHRAANTSAAWVLGVSVALGFVSCLWTMLVVVFDPGDRPPRILPIPLTLAIAQVVCLIVGVYFLL